MERTHIDLAYLERFCKGDRARMEKYIRMYLNGAPALFAKLEDRLNAGDGEGLAVAAHSVRPQVNYMGAQHLFDLLTGIEERSRSEGPSVCTAEIKEALSVNEAVMGELRMELSQS